MFTSQKSRAHKTPLEYIRSPISLEMLVRTSLPVDVFITWRTPVEVNVTTSKAREVIVRCGVHCCIACAAELRVHAAEKGGYLTVNEDPPQ